MSSSFQIGLVFTGVLVGILLTAHFQTNVPTSSSSYPFEQYEAQRELVKSYLDEQVLLKSRIATLRSALDLIQKESQSFQNDTITVLQDLKRGLGLIDQEGSGIAVEIDDSKSAKRGLFNVNEDAIVHAADLRDIINTLWSVDADAITINDQRIVLSTSISGVGNTILVNNTTMLPPFSIAAIGHQDAMLSKLSSENALPDLYRRIRDYGLRFKIEPRPYIHATFYTGSFRTEFIKTVEQK